MASPAGRHTVRTARHRGGRKPLLRRGLAASAVLASAALLANGATNAGTGQARYRAAMTTRPAPPSPAVPAGDPLLAESTTWFHQATTSLGAIHRQLTILSRAQQAGRAVPPDGRTPRLRELLHRLAAQITMLRHEETGLQTALTVHELYQSSSGQLAALNTALARLHQTSSPSTVGTDPQPTATLAQQQSALARQVRAWSSGLRQALTLPLPVPTPTATRLAHRVITAATEPPPVLQAPLYRPPVLQPASLRKLRLPTHPHGPARAGGGRAATGDEALMRNTEERGPA